MLRVGEMVVDAGQMGMSQAGQQRNLAVEGVGGLNHLLRAQPDQPDFFERHLLPAHQRILGQVNGPETARSHLPQQPVPLLHDTLATGNGRGSRQRLPAGKAGSRLRLVRGTTIRAKEQGRTHCFPSIETQSMQGQVCQKSLLYIR